MKEENEEPEGSEYGDEVWAEIEAAAVKKARRKVVKTIVEAKKEEKVKELSPFEKQMIEIITPRRMKLD